MTWPTRPAAITRRWASSAGNWAKTQYAYARSFENFEIDFSFRTNDDSYAKSVDKLKAWYAQLDAELEAAVEGGDR